MSQCVGCFFFFFFFQAEDGIRDYKVTGVQTFALPISISTKQWGSGCQKKYICRFEPATVDKNVDYRRQPARKFQEPPLAKPGAILIHTTSPSISITSAPLFRGGQPNCVNAPKVRRFAGFHNST